MSLTRRQLMHQTLGVSLTTGAGLFCGLLPQNSKSQARRSPPPLPTYPCRKVQPFAIDGDLQKKVWSSCRTMTLVPATGKPARLQPTTAKACWSETHLYVGFSCRDTQIGSTFTKRDEPLYEQDVVEVFLSLPGDLQRYLEFEFSARNVIFDARVFNPGKKAGAKMELDLDWNCVGLQSAVKVKGDLEDRSRRDEEWSVEVAIPFAGMGVAAPAAGARWRGNFYRIDYGKPTEYSAWSPTLADPASYHVPERFGWLVFEKS
jgi:hypothetical protein